MVPASRWSATVLLAALLVTSGCLGVVTGNESLTFAAEPVGVSDDARADAGYEEVRAEAQSMSREYTVAGQTRRVEVTNHVAEYSRSVAVAVVGPGEFARFAVLSTPAVEIAGRTFNPVGDLSNRELAEQVQEQYEGLDDVRPAGERSVTVLGTETTVSTFAGRARLAAGQSVEVTVHVARLRHGDDFVIAVGIHPSVLGGESDRVDTMLRGIEHEAG